MKAAFRKKNRTVFALIGCYAVIFMGANPHLISDAWSEPAAEQAVPAVPPVMDEEARADMEFYHNKTVNTADRLEAPVPYNALGRSTDGFHTSNI